MTTPIDRETLTNHLDGLRRLARRLVLDDHEADDVIQDAAVAAMESRSEPTVGLRAWLAGVTRNKARRTARGAGRRRHHERAAARPEAVASTADLVIRAAEQSRLLDILARMEEPYRAALLMRFIEDLPPREIAARLGMPVETVRTHVKRGLGRLREHLDEAHPGGRSTWMVSLTTIAEFPVGAVATTSLALPALLVVGGIVALLGLLLVFGWGHGGEAPTPALESADEGAPQGGAADAEPGGPAVDPEGKRADSPSGPGVLREGADAERDGRPSAGQLASAPQGPSPEVLSLEVPASGPFAWRGAEASRVTQPGEPTGTFAYSDNGYVNLDPAHASLHRRNDERLILALLEGLTTLNPATGRARPGVAHRWRLARDGLTWTFQLRRDARWSDGSPVTSTDFIRAWRRVMDPFTFSEWSWLYRPIKACGAIRDNSAMTDGFSELRNAIKELLVANPNGIPGEDLNLALDDTGMRPFLAGVKSRSVERLLKWKDGDLLPLESVKKVMDALKKERRKAKGKWVDVFDAFGKIGSGLHAPDDHTLVVVTTGDVPYLPELVARSAFAPLHISVDKLREAAFEVGGYVTNGPFILKGRGAKPREGPASARAISMVELVHNPRYHGANPPRVARILAKTDLSLRRPAEEDVFEFERGTLQWVNATWPEWPKKKLRTKIEGMDGFGARESPRVLYLRFRCDRAPFRDKAARKAFALAVDRSILAKRYWPEATPAHRLVPPGIAGRVEGITCPKPDTARAKEAFKKAGLDSDSWIELSYGEAPGHDEVARALTRGWKKIMGVESGLHIQSDDDVRNVLRAGRYYVMLTEFRGAVNDPGAYLEPLHSKDADSGLGWADEAYNALLDAARDPQVALCDPDGWLATVGDPSLQAALSAAKRSREGRLRLRREILASAERRLLKEYVVVPLLFLREATLFKGVEGLSSDEARRNPGFVESLGSVTR